jgi:hypothetical protein
MEVYIDGYYQHTLNNKPSGLKGRGNSPPNRVFKKAAIGF